MTRTQSAVWSFATSVAIGGVLLSTSAFAGARHSAHTSQRDALADSTVSASAAGSAPTVEVVEDSRQGYCRRPNGKARGWETSYEINNAKHRRVVVTGQVVSVRKSGYPGSIGPRGLVPKPKTNHWNFGEAWELVTAQNGGHEYYLPPGKQTVVYKIKVAGYDHVIKVRSTIPPCK